MIQSTLGESNETTPPIKINEEESDEVAKKKPKLLESAKAEKKNNDEFVKLGLNGEQPSTTLMRFKDDAFRFLQSEFPRTAQQIYALPVAFKIHAQPPIDPPNLTAREQRVWEMTILKVWEIEYQSDSKINQDLNLESMKLAARIKQLVTDLLSSKAAATYPEMGIGLRWITSTAIADVLTMIEVVHTTSMGVLERTRKDDAYKRWRDFTMAKKEAPEEFFRRFRIELAQHESVLGPMDEDAKCAAMLSKLELPRFYQLCFIINQGQAMKESSIRLGLAPTPGMGYPDTIAELMQLVLVTHESTKSY